MNLQPHKNYIRDGKRNKGYTIRVGKKIPYNSANLAYVHAKSLSPEENILLEDVSSLITENGLSSFTEKEYLVYPTSDCLLETEDGRAKFPTDVVSVTDEFTIKAHRQDTPKPVFYRMELSGRFDARYTQVIPYEGGYTSLTKQDGVSFESLSPSERSQLLYVGDSIRIEQNGRPIDDDHAFKVQLVRESNFTYRIILYTDFQSEKEITYKVAYPSYDSASQKSVIKEEVLNAYPFFEEVTNEQFEGIIKQMGKDSFAHSKVYTVVDNGEEYSFYATSDMLVANYETRQPQLFKHRVAANLKTKLSETNPGTMNIGFYFVHEAVGVQNLASIGKTLNEHTLLPSYITLENPHPIELDLLKKDIRYWAINLDMPEHHYEDYDMIVITGYGTANLSMYKDKLNHFLANGGTIWVDNAGSGMNVLNLQSFVADIQFSKSSNEFGVKQLQTDEAYASRLYTITDSQSLGYVDISPAIVFGVDEEKEQWHDIATHLNGGPSIIKRTANDKGLLIVSNCGILRGVYQNQTINNYFALNTILHHAEQQWVLTPWRNEFVYHKDNLFAQEYKVNNTDIYINDRNDYNANEIVAKKILHKSCKEYVKSFCKKWFYNATGMYDHIIDGDIQQPVNNSGFESGSANLLGEPITEWREDTKNAIPGWNTKKLAGKEAVFSHVYDDSMHGVRHIALNVTDSTIGAQAYWESEEIYLAADDYKLSAYLATENVSGITTDGVKIAVYNLAGEQLASSVAAAGTKDMSMGYLSFTLNKPQSIHIRIGFVDGNGFGKASFDDVNLCTAGTVKGVATNEGEKPLYAFSVKPNAATIDIEAEGFGNANITRATPEIPFTFSIKPFIYQWLSYGVDTSTGIEIGRYERMYGKEVSYEHRIRKSDGLVNLGFLHALLPAIPAGKEWHDKNKIYYTISLGANSDKQNQLVNLKLFNRKTGMEWYYSDELVIGYKDIFWATVKPSFVLHADTNYETIRATKRNFGLKLIDDKRIYPVLPQTTDAKENWYLRVHNGEFTKSHLGYKEWEELYDLGDESLLKDYQGRVMRKEKYEVKEYDSQIFYPSKGVMQVENELEYLTSSSVKVPHNNLHILTGSVEMEELSSYGIVGSYNIMRHRYDSFENLENGPAGRVVTNNTVAEVSQEKAMDGINSLKISGTAPVKEVYLDQAQSAATREPIVVAAGQVYIFSFYAQAPTSGEATALVQLTDSTVLEGIPVKIGTDWQRVEFAFEAPVGTNYVGVGIRFIGEILYVDCTQFEIS